MAQQHTPLETLLISVLLKVEEFLDQRIAIDAPTDEMALLEEIRTVLDKVTKL